MLQSFTHCRSSRSQDGPFFFLAAVRKFPTIVVHAIAIFRSPTALALAHQLAKPIFFGFPNSKIREVGSLACPIVHRPAGVRGVEWACYPLWIFVFVFRGLAHWLLQEVGDAEGRE